MKKIIVILVLVLLLKPAVPIAEYLINYDYISQVLCINKAKPEMHCNGKCHLMKELAKASENEKPLSSNKKNASQESEILFFEAIPTFKMPFFCFQKEQNTTSKYNNLYSYLSTCSVFHPPTIIS